VCNTAWSQALTKSPSSVGVCIARGIKGSGPDSSAQSALDGLLCSSAVCARQRPSPRMAGPDRVPVVYIRLQPVQSTLSQRLPVLVLAPDGTPTNSPVQSSPVTRPNGPYRTLTQVLLDRHLNDCSLSYMQDFAVERQDGGQPTMRPLGA
jgi:hypothetical protein